MIKGVCLSRFSPVGADLLARRLLLRRSDSKFLLGISELNGLLAEVSDHYGVLAAGDEMVANYRTLYFDTRELRCFHDHRRGRRPRHKVRIRHYPERNVSFLEVKTKRSEQLTIKKRRELPFGSDSLGPEELRFLAISCDLPVAQLVPQVWTNFRRITLVGFATNERVTVDLDVRFVGETEHALETIVILEVKQSPFCMRTPIMAALRARKMRFVSASKYCTATAVTHPGIRLNRLLPAVRAMRKGMP